MPRALRRASVPMIQAIRAEAIETLPKRGGLNEYVAAARISTTVKTGAETATVQIRGRRNQIRRGGKQVDLPAINRGRIRHPTYGHGPWTTQSVAPGFWDTGAEKAAGAVDQQLQKAMDDMHRRIEAGS